MASEASDAEGVRPKAVGIKQQKVVFGKGWVGLGGVGLGRVG